MSERLTLILLRHGSTAGNERRAYVGRQTDEPLSERGRAHCVAAGPFPLVDKVYASPMRRARETAALCFPAGQIEQVPGLEEMDFGAFEGRTYAQMEHDAAYRQWVESGCVDACPGGESRAAYVARSNAALVSLLRGACRRGERQVVVVAHGGTVMAALSAFADECATAEAMARTNADGYFCWHTGCCEGYEAEAQLDGDSVRLKNLRRFPTR